MQREFDLFLNAWKGIVMLPFVVGAGAALLFSGGISHSLDQGKIGPGVPRFLSTLAAQPYNALTAPFEDLVGKFDTPLDPRGPLTLFKKFAENSRDVIVNVLPQVSAMQKSIGPPTEFSLFSEGSGLPEAQKAVKDAAVTVKSLADIITWAAKTTAKATGDKKFYETTHNVTEVMNSGVGIAQKTFMTLVSATIGRV